MRESSVQGGFVISYYFNGRAYHAPVMPFTHPSTSAVTYSLDEGKTKFYDLLQLVEFYQLNKGTLCGKLTHFVINKISVTRSESPTDSTSSCKHASDVSLDRWVGCWKSAILFFFPSKFQHLKISMQTKNEISKEWTSFENKYLENYVYKFHFWNYLFMIYLKFMNFSLAFFSP